MFKSLNRGISTSIAIIIIVVCALIVGGIVVYQYYGIPKEEEEVPETIKPPENKTPEDETADWQTYRNEEYGYEISYPGNWHLYLEQNQPLFVKKEASTPPVELEAYGEQVGIWVTEGMINPFTKTPFASREEWISWYEDYFQDSDGPREKKWQTINGTEVLIIKTVAPHTSYYFLYYVIFKEEKAYSFHLYPYDETDPVYSKNIEIFNQMLSTFRFLEKEEPYIEVLSPNGGEEWQERKEHTVKWGYSKDLEYWGNVVTICLLGSDIKGDVISAKGEWKNTICDVYTGGACLVIETTLTENAYQWMIPEDISERFEESPSFYKIQLLVFDNLPPEGRTEWAGLITSDESDDYFSIVAD